MSRMNVKCWKYTLGLVDIESKIPQKVLGICTNCKNGFWPAWGGWWDENIFCHQVLTFFLLWSMSLSPSFGFGRVLTSKSHRGKHENMWNQVDNNFERKTNFEIFLRFLRSEISKLRDFICPKCQKNGFPPTSRWCKKFLEVLWRQTKIPVKLPEIGLSLTRKTYKTGVYLKLLLTFGRRKGNRSLSRKSNSKTHSWIPRFEIFWITHGSKLFKFYFYQRFAPFSML